MSPVLSVRRAGSEDAAAVRALTPAAYAKWVPVIGREPTPMTADFDRVVVTNPIDLLLADGALVALVWMVQHPDHLLIENLATAPAYQGRGYGRRLLAHAEAFANRLGLPEMRLYTNRLFTANVELYLRCGYRIDREEAFWGGVKVHMSKPTAPPAPV